MSANSSSIKRIVRDTKDFRNNPLTGVELQTSEENVFRCTVWFEIDANVWLPMVVIYPNDYPFNPPNCGFPVDFGYTLGASYINNTGDLAGMMVVCLDILGNFAHVHNEWAKETGSGWSNSYTITTLAVVMQNVIKEEFENKSSDVKNRVKQACMTYMQTHFPSSLSLSSAAEEPAPPTAAGTPAEEKRSSPSSTNSSSSSASASASSSATGAEQKKGEEDGWLSQRLLTAMASADHSVYRLFGTSSTTHISLPALQATMKEMAGYVAMEKKRKREEEECNLRKLRGKVIGKPEEIFCWFSKMTYEEGILGYGIQRTRDGSRHWHLSTDGNYIAYDAFAQEHLRQYPNKDEFHFFLPAWIHSSHVHSRQTNSHNNNNNVWLETMKAALREMGDELGYNGYVNTIMFVFPELMNNMVVEMMDRFSSDNLRPSSLVFRCLLNLWRTLCYLLDIIPGLRSAMFNKVQQFIANERCRRKDVTPNLGWILVMTLIFPTTSTSSSNPNHPNQDGLDWSAFLTAFEKEAGLRRVLWWQRERVVQDDDVCTFLQSSISRDTVLFQVMLRCILHSKPLEERIVELDTMYCNIEDDVESILKQWKALQDRVELGFSWLVYFEELQRMGLPQQYVPTTKALVPDYLTACVKEANQLKGYHDVDGSYYRSRRDRRDSSPEYW